MGVFQNKSFPSNGLYCTVTLLAEQIINYALHKASHNERSVHTGLTSWAFMWLSGLLSSSKGSLSFISNVSILEEMDWSEPW